MIINKEHNILTIKDGDFVPATLSFRRSAFSGKEFDSLIAGGYDFYLLIPATPSKDEKVSSTYNIVGRYVYELVEPKTQEEIDAEDIAEIESSYKARLAQTDAEMSRVLEDLIKVLNDKGILLESELPAAARDKLSLRRGARLNLSDVSAVDDDGIITTEERGVIQTIKDWLTMELW